MCDGKETRPSSGEGKDTQIIDISLWQSERGRPVKDGDWDWDEVRQ